MEIVPGALNYQSIINSWNASNVTVTGSGVIDGQGQPWWERCTASAQTVSSVSASHRTVILQSSCSRPVHKWLGRPRRHPLPLPPSGRAMAARQ